MFKQRWNKAVRKKLLITIKLIASLYVLLFMIGYMTSSTGAYFNDLEEEQQVIQAGTWWDGSNLSFTGETSQSDTCPTEKISVTVQNDGYNMLGSTEYNVYFSEAGNPKLGKVISSGTVEPLEENGIVNVKYENTKEGIYQFYVRQRDGFPDKERQEIWSEEIVVKCDETDKKSTEDMKNKTEASPSNQKSEEEMLKENATNQQTGATEKQQDKQTDEQKIEKDQKTKTDEQEETKRDKTTGDEHIDTKATDQKVNDSEANQETDAAIETKTGKEQKDEQAN